MANVKYPTIKTVAIAVTIKVAPALNSNQISPARELASMVQIL